MSLFWSQPKDVEFAVKGGERNQKIFTQENFMHNKFLRNFMHFLKTYQF